MIFNYIIQCRMSSKRFPGKVLATFLKKPLLDHVVQQIKKTHIQSTIVLATSTDNSDNPLVSHAKELGLKIVRGSLNNVVERYALALDRYSCDAFFRVCGDSPLLLPHLFNQAALIYKNKPYDIVTNLFPRTFPAGMSVELIQTKTFLEIRKNIIDDSEKEHLSKHFYNNFDKFKIHNIECNLTGYQNLQLAIDEYGDLERIESWLLGKKDKIENLFPIKFSK